MHIKEESNTKNVIIEGQYFPLSCEYNIEQKVVYNTEVLKTMKGTYVNGKVCGQNVRFLVDTGADVTLISLNSLKKFPNLLSSNWKYLSLEIYTVNGEKVKTWEPVQVN